MQQQQMHAGLPTMPIPHSFLPLSPACRRVHRGWGLRAGGARGHQGGAAAGQRCRSGGVLPAPPARAAGAPKVGVWEGLGHKYLMVCRFGLAWQGASSIQHKQHSLAQARPNCARLPAACLPPQAEHPDVIGEVRGEGLMIGMEVVTDPASQAPSPALARALKQHCKRRHRVLLSSEGPFCSVIKVKPPLCFSEAQADAMVAALGDALRALSDSDKAALAAASRAEVEGIEERHRRLS